MVRRALITLAVLTLVRVCVLAGEEACRIRICNKPDGLVQVSLDGGVKWSTVGRVKHPANARIVGFAASAYVPHGTVAATAVHGLRIKTGQYSLGIGKEQKTMLFSVEPREFWTIPNGYGGHQPRSSGVYTDIYAGHSIFRNESPYVGNAVYIERDHQLQPLPTDYMPVEGETFVIIVTRPPVLGRDALGRDIMSRPNTGADKPIASIDFENKPQGKVTVRYTDGSSEVIASVVRPVQGVGRYDGTTFTGVGAVNTSHGGVLTISTAPTCLPMTIEGGSEETRGGFMIQPCYHVAEQGETSPQVMVVGPIAEPGRQQNGPRLEGTPPLFFGNINTTRYWGKPEFSFVAQVRIDDGEWEDVPQIIGKVDDAFTPAYLNKYFAAKGQPRDIKQGVTAVRLRFPRYDRELLAEDVAQEASSYAARVKDLKPVKGTVAVKPSCPAAGNPLVRFYLDGTLAYMASGSSVRWDWNTTKCSNGLHEIEIETEGISSVERRVVLVSN